MVKTKELLRLKYCTDLSNRQIATSLGIARSTVADYLHRAEEAGIGWPLPEGLSETELEQRLFTKPQLAGDSHRAAPDWPQIHEQMKRKGVTLMLLWQEYKEQLKFAEDFDSLGWACASRQPAELAAHQDTRPGGRDGRGVGRP